MKTEEYIECIEHDGVVQHVDGPLGIVKVAVSDDEGCGECPAAAVCSARNKSVIEVHTSDARSYRPGDRVIVSGEERMHPKALMLATVLPCIALVVIMVAVYIATADQLTAVLCGLGATVFFYFILYLCRYHIARQFTFTIAHT